ncbi:2'-5' RNA ligase family protein [Hymenobacter chitinivorans]|uniref:2'-5' RNA ligase n=1 Tax=Hymenobacter chitinivorans DSM 11115 TaxID=1121954 RepID=A0A2M9AQY2_9BACT|nr:mutarotase [Hymenobacter chitinivorans]PJJ48100.1 hypothetical protein CLV45_4793 [Hymenobacter chitinivorans DSM 11115]
MDLPAYYDEMHQAALPLLARGAVVPDPLLQAPEQDQRRGLTLLTRPPAPILAALTGLLADFERLEPAQYYYPATDIHLTILSIISCYPGFTLDQVDPAAYQAAGQAVVAGVGPFRVEYRGLAATPGGIIVRGFPRGPGLEELRHNVRQHFRHSALPQSIDQRYSIQTAHSTLIRFRAPLQHPAALARLVEHYQEHVIGSFEVHTVELVYNDWYQRAANTIRLAEYALSGD